MAATALAAAAPAEAREAYARRQFLLEANTRCQLLNERERAALSGAAGQARGVLLRAGLRPEPIRRAAADRAAGTLCDDALLRAEAETARAAFTGWAAMQQQSFAGEHQTWHTSRAGAEAMMAWTLWQDLPGGARLGVVEDAEGRALVAALPAAGPARPHAISLQFRDARKWPEFMESTLGGLFRTDSSSALASRAAPVALSRQVWAAGRPERAVQAPPGADGFFYWLLPLETLDEMAALDPRDAARLTLEYPGGRVETLYLEVGDLAAAMAFLAAGATPSSGGAQS